MGFSKTTELAFSIKAYFVAKFQTIRPNKTSHVKVNHRSVQVALYPTYILLDLVNLVQFESRIIRVNKIMIREGFH